MKNKKNKPGCWTKETKSLSGQVARWSSEYKLGHNYYGFTLMDGTNVSLDLCHPMYAEFSLPDDMHRPFVIFYVDLNGDKTPNMLGRDIYAFAMDGRGVIPFGNANKSAYCTASKNNSSAGFDCAQKVLLSAK